MLEFIVKTHDEKIWDISELVTKVSYNDRLNDGCSKLEFSYIDDDLKLENGNEVRFKYENTYIFVGRIFRVGRGKGKEISVTAYDQLRYAKAKDYFTTSTGETIASLISRMCNKYGFNRGHIANVKYALKANIYDGDTWLDILYGAIKDTLYRSEKWYVLRDEAGYITLRVVEDLKYNFVLGDGSLCYDYNYEKSIDDNFYNRILLLAVEGDTGTFVAANDEKSIKKYGLMQYYERKDKTNKAQARTWADIMLKDYNHEPETLSLDCLGDVRVRAGTQIATMIEDIMGANMVRWFIVRSVTHDFLPIHTMKIDMAT
jgi:hypothetical protein